MKPVGIAQTYAYTKFMECVERFHIFDGVEKVVACYSGGKSSTVLLDLLCNYRQVIEMAIDAVLVPFPTHVYEDPSPQLLATYWAGQGICVHVYQDEAVLGEAEETLEESSNPCSICKNIRRDGLRRILTAKFGEQGLTIATAHSLWDLAAYSIELLLLGEAGSETRTKLMSGRVLEVSGRLAPRVQLADRITLIHPTIMCDEPDFADHLHKRQLPTLKSDCRYLFNRPKRLLFRLFEQISCRFDYDAMLDTYAKMAQIPGAQDFLQEDWTTFLV